MKKLIAMLTIVVMLSSCGVMNKIDNTDLLSTKSPQSEETSDLYQEETIPAMAMFLVISGICLISLWQYCEFTG
jgi:heme/copper-type cytochrome/quinol oxidase subunit 2